jgi:hypothetical protein
MSHPTPSAVVVIPAYNPPFPGLYKALMIAGLPFIIREGVSDQTRARGQLLTMALDTGAERVVLIDADMDPTAEQIVALATDGRVTPDCALSGLYPLKTRQHWAYDAASNRAGLGFCCVHRESLLRLRATLGIVKTEEAEWTPFTMPTYRDGRYSGNDFAFWDRLREHGVGLLVDPGLVVAHRFMASFERPDVA